jgi:hypothetical protein
MASSARRAKYVPTFGLAFAALLPLRANAAAPPWFVLADAGTGPVVGARPEGAGIGIAVGPEIGALWRVAPNWALGGYGAYTFCTGTDIGGHLFRTGLELRWMPGDYGRSTHTVGWVQGQIGVAGFYAVEQTDVLTSVESFVGGPTFGLSAGADFRVAGGLFGDYLQVHPTWFELGGHVVGQFFPGAQSDLALPTVYISIDLGFRFDG